MKADFFAYWNSLWNDIPIWVYEAGLLVLLAGWMICSLTCGIRKGLKYGLGLLLIEYVLLIYCSTVFFRNTGQLQYDFMPFWSYRDYFNGVNGGLLAENIMNVVVFVPVGLVAGATFRSMSWKKVLVIGICLSVGIETLQFVFRKGFSEFDDVMHNTLGCLIGYGMCKAISALASIFFLFRFGSSRLFC